MLVVQLLRSYNTCLSVKNVLLVKATLPSLLSDVDRLAVDEPEGILFTPNFLAIPVSVLTNAWKAPVLSAMNLPFVEKLRLFCFIPCKSVPS